MVRAVESVECAQAAIVFVAIVLTLLLLELAACATALHPRPEIYPSHVSILELRHFGALVYAECDV